MLADLYCLKQPSSITLIYLKRDLNRDLCMANLYHTKITQNHKTDASKLWLTIKAIYSKAKSSADNEAINFNDTPISKITSYISPQPTFLKPSSCPEPMPNGFHLQSNSDFVRSSLLQASV